MGRRSFVAFQKRKEKGNEQLKARNVFFGI
jgi:hypothetical protein